MLAVCLDYFVFSHQHAGGTHNSGTNMINLRTKWKLQGLFLMQSPLTVGIIINFRKEKNIYYGRGGENKYHMTWTEATSPFYSKTLMNDVL